MHRPALRREVSATMRGERAADHPGSRGNDLSTALRSRIYGRNAISTHLDFLQERSERKLAIRSGSIYGYSFLCGTPGVRRPVSGRPREVPDVGRCASPFDVSSTLALRPGAAFAPRGLCAAAAEATAGSLPRASPFPGSSIVQDLKTSCLGYISVDSDPIDAKIAVLPEIYQ